MNQVPPIAAYPAPITVKQRVHEGLQCMYTVMPITNLVKGFSAVGLCLLNDPCVNRCYNQDPGWVVSYIAALIASFAVDTIFFTYGAVKGPSRPNP